mmetsp:Transcript_17432/g.66395  ORF Transcript_17432/g.66395 Transcript_17432/m.66395 type:complete len:278 (-) Transcript_17432:364-1197(-)
MLVDVLPVVLKQLVGHEMQLAHGHSRGGDCNLRPLPHQRGRRHENLREVLPLPQRRPVQQPESQDEGELPLAEEKAPAIRSSLLPDIALDHFDDPLANVHEAPCKIRRGESRDVLKIFAHPQIVHVNPGPSRSLLAGFGLPSSLHLARPLALSPRADDPPNRRLRDEARVHWHHRLLLAPGPPLRLHLRRCLGGVPVDAIVHVFIRHERREKLHSSALEDLRRQRVDQIAPAPHARAKGGVRRELCIHPAVLHRPHQLLLRPLGQRFSPSAPQHELG